MVLNDTLVENNIASQNGGGAINDSCPLLTIENGSVISGNRAASSGGGIAMDTYNGSVPTVAVVNSTISDNTSSQSGGGIEIDTGTATITGGTISNNTAAGSGTGGGIDAQSGVVVTITGTTLSANSAPGWGGGISSDGTLTVVNCTFSLNQGAYGGGIGEQTGHHVIGRFHLHRENTANYNGGAVSSDGVNTVFGCTFDGNVADATSGGGDLGGGAMGWDNAMTIFNCTFVANSTPGDGGALANFGGVASITNCNDHQQIPQPNTAAASTAAAALWRMTFLRGKASAATDPDFDGTATGNNNLIGNGTGMTGLTNGTNGNQVGTSASPINPLLGLPWPTMAGRQRRCRCNRAAPLRPAVVRLQH